MMRELIAALDQISRDAAVRVVILAAAGKVFCSGHDLSEMTGRPLTHYREVFDVCTELMTRLQTIPQPVIAEVQGLATAAGCQLAATCDLVVAVKRRSSLRRVSRSAFSAPRRWWLSRGPSDASVPWRCCSPAA
jgi:enoyl-CoA hydratase/carnithine racemase